MKQVVRMILVNFKLIIVIRKIIFLLRKNSRERTCAAHDKNIEYMLLYKWPFFVGLHLDYKFYEWFNFTENIQKKCTFFFKDLSWNLSSISTQIRVRIKTAKNLYFFELSVSFDFIKSERFMNSKKNLS